MNVDETGKLELMPEQPRIGSPVTAALRDPDGILIDPSDDLQTVTTWEWYRTASDTVLKLDEDGEVPTNGALMMIPGATQATTLQMVMSANSCTSG